MGVDTYTGYIDEGSNCSGDGEGGDMIPTPFLLSVMLDECEYKNDNDDGGI